MSTTTLGKILKAMQKLSGLSVGDLADRSDLTIDTVNNLFYARVQKPGFSGICSLVESMGFSLALLDNLLHTPGIDTFDLPQLEELIVSLQETKSSHRTGGGSAPPLHISPSPASRILPPASSAGVSTSFPVASRSPSPPDASNSLLSSDNLLTKIKQQYESQLAQSTSFSETTIHGLEKLVDEQRARVNVTAQRYEKELEELRASHERTVDKQQQFISQLRKTNNILLLLIILETLAVIFSFFLK